MRAETERAVAVASSVKASGSFIISVHRAGVGDEEHPHGGLSNARVARNLGLAGLLRLNHVEDSWIVGAFGNEESPQGPCQHESWRPTATRRIP